MKLISQSKCLSFHRPQIMGILNVTPDSFSDGGQFSSLDAALFHAESMLKNGAHILDIGGESTRPGAPLVCAEEELSRVIPVIEGIRARFDCWLSVDTSKAIVMKEAALAGVDLINDVRALQEKGALKAAIEADIPVCLMHMQGQPQTMQIQPQYSDVLQSVHDFFKARIRVCEEHGLNRNKMIIDPGFGFGKNRSHNYHLLSKLDEFHQYGLPLLAGMSRKSMIFKLLGRSPEDVLAGSLACATIALMKGAHIIRVHDVKETSDVVQVFNALNEVEEISGETQ